MIIRMKKELEDNHNYEEPHVLNVKIRSLEVFLIKQ